MKELSLLSVNTNYAVSEKIICFPFFIAWSFLRQLMSDQAARGGRTKLPHDKGLHF